MMQIHSKRLLSLWDQKKFSPDTKRHQKTIDGVFIFQSLFSVAAFASRQESTVATKLAKKTAEMLLGKTRTLRNDVNQQHRLLLQNMGDIDINLTPDHEPQTLTVDAKRYTPENVMLMKVFLAYDDYFMTLHKAKMNGEITEREQQSYRKEAITQLTELLNSINRTCISFHKVRKEAECAS
ncbi:DUF1845 domain-containing protein [Vibrio jasicida]|uniref:DUF1845 domain-containing protein n=1 Tax=Vibrio jasicida TaxID=766224 RepID=UPI000AB625AF|nr:DUF1845 domain-containing protein [Vibrio jasicida]